MKEMQQQHKQIEDEEEAISAMMEMEEVRGLRGKRGCLTRSAASRPMLANCRHHMVSCVHINVVVA